MFNLTLPAVRGRHSIQKLMATGSFQTFEKQHVKYKNSPRYRPHSRRTVIRYGKKKKAPTMGWINLKMGNDVTHLITRRKSVTCGCSYSAIHCIPLRNMRVCQTHSLRFSKPRNIDVRLFKT